MGSRQDKNKVIGAMSNIGKVAIGDTTNIYQHAEVTFPKELTLNLPKTHPDDIVGREDDLEELHDLLSTKERVVLVNGLGGIGKTTLAQAYISKYYNEYQHIAWIAQDSDNIANDFVNTQGLIENLGIQPADFQPQQLFAEVIRKLKIIPNRPNLLIIDNAEQSVKQYLYMLPSQPDWHLLVTSREEIQGLYPKELDFLSLEKAIELFKKHYTHKKINDGQISELVKMVDRHTLTVEILAKTAEELRYDIDKLRTAIEDDLKASLDVKHNRKHTEIDKITSYLATVFNLSNLNEAEIWLMKQFACLPSEFHTYDLLKDILIDGDADPVAFTETLNSLARKGWLRQNKDTDSYKMHRILTDVTKGKLDISSEDVITLIQSISWKLYLDQSRDSPVDKFIWIPFGKALLVSFNNETDDEISKFQNNLALVLKEFGDYQGAMTLLEKTVASSAKNFGPDHPTTITHYSNLATVFVELGDYQGAKLLMEKVTASAEKNFGKHHPKTATSYSNLATVVLALGDYHRAKSLLEKAVAADEKNFGKNHPATATSYSNLAAVLNALGDYQSAKALVKKAITSDEKKFGTEHPITATRYSNLALILQNLHDYQGAKTLLEKAVVSAEKNFGKDHGTTATRYSNLALVLKDLGDYSGAKALLEKATVSNEKNFGNDNPKTAISYNNLATVHYKLENYNEALELSNTALAIFKKTLPAGHPSIETANWWNEEIKNKMKQMFF